LRLNGMYQPLVHANDFIGWRHKYHK
jgi:hypothetical protein